MLYTILFGVGGGLFFSWAASKCKGKNARNAMNHLSTGCWLFLLLLVPFNWFGPIGWILNLFLIKLIPSIIFFLMAGNSFLKEIRAQQRGDYTDRAI